MKQMVGCNGPCSHIIFEYREGASGQKDAANAHNPFMEPTWRKKEQFPRRPDINVNILWVL